MLMLKLIALALLSTGLFFGGKLAYERYTLDGINGPNVGEHPLRRYWPWGGWGLCR